MDSVEIVQFEGQPLTQLTYQGKPAWIAREVGAVLGYADEGRRLVVQVRGDWVEELMPEVDYTVVEGGALTELKALVTEYVTSGLSGEAPDTLSSRAPSIMLLFESGLNLVCLLSRKPAGARMRRWLAESILPRLARGEGIPPAGAPSGQPKASAALPPDLAPLGALLDVYERMKALDVPGEALQALARRITEEAEPPRLRPTPRKRGGRVWARLPGEDTWLNTSEFAERFKMTQRCALLAMARAEHGGKWRGLEMEIRRGGRP